MEKSIEDLEREREDLQNKANELKRRRDQLHEESKRLCEERDQLNAEIRNLRNKIRDHRKKRDELNQRVKEAKKKRDELNKIYLEAKRKIKEIEKSRSSALGINLNKLKKELKKLEHEQMTQPMTPQKEKEVIERIAHLHAQIKEHERKLNEDIKLKRALEELKIAKERAEKQHAKVEELAEKAQNEHETMLKLLKQTDSLVKRVNEIQERIIFIKIDADKTHKSFIECVDKIHELEREISSLKETHRRERRSKETSSIKKEASEIFERFKRGEKLSTEDILLLQKAGLI